MNYGSQEYCEPVQLAAGRGVLGTGSPVELRSGSRCNDDPNPFDPTYYSDATVVAQTWSSSENQLWFGQGDKISTSGGCRAANGPFVATAPAGETWLTCYDESGLEVGRFSSASPADVTWFWELAGIPGPITVAPDGSAWFTQSELPPPFGGAHRNAIGRIDPQGHVIAFQAGLSGMGYHDSGVHGITVGPDGNIWFTEPAADRVGRITPAGVISEFPLAAGANPQGIAAGPGRTLWFTEPGLNRIGRIDLNEAPGASIGVGGSSIVGGQVVFEATASSDPDGVIADYRWDFGDGSGAAGARVDHAYARAGTYTVAVLVTDNEGAQARAQRQVVISNPAVRVQQAGARVRWDLGGAKGSLQVSGNSDRATRVAFALAKGAKSWSLGARDIPAGPFSIRLAAPAGLRPGLYQLHGRPLEGGAIDVLSAPVTVTAPRQGIVDRAVAVDASNRPVRAVRPLGTRQLRARFHLAVAPNRGVDLEARWSIPGRKKPIVDPAPRRRAGGFVTASILSRRANLPQGVYVCRLRAGATTIASIKIRIG